MIPKKQLLMPLGIPSTTPEALGQFGRIPKRDTEPFTSRCWRRRVDRDAHHLALVTRSQVHAIWYQHRRTRCGHVNAFLFLALGGQAAQSDFPTRQRRSRWAWGCWSIQNRLHKHLGKRRCMWYVHNPCSLQLAQGLCRSDGSRQDPVRQTTLSSSLTHVSVPRLSPATSS